MSRDKILRNIPLLYVIKIAKWFSLVMPIVVLFFREENNLTLQQVFTLKAIYSVAVVLLEIPSGYLSDVWGRRKTLILGTILGTIGFAIYSFNFNFYEFVLAEIILGIGVSFISGSDSALLYDSLSSANQSNKYLKIEGRITSIGNFAEAIAGILGAWLAVISLRTPYMFQTVVAFLGVPAALLLVEPKTHNKLKDYSFINILKIVKYALFENPVLKWNIIYSAIIGCSTLTMAWFVQAYLEEFSVNVSRYGYIWASLNITVAAVSFQAYKLERRLKQRKTVTFILIGNN